MMLDIFSRTPEETIPIIKGITVKSVPMAMYRPLEAEVFRNFGRTLKRLAEHRGMTAKEALCLLQGQPVICGNEVQNTVAEKVLIDMVRMWRDNLLAADPANMLEEEKESPKEVTVQSLFNEKMRVDFPEIIEAVDRPGFAWDNLNAAEQDNLLDSLTGFINRKLKDGVVAMLNVITRNSNPNPLEKTQLLIDAIKHGDEEHQDWLTAAIYAHFTNTPLPEYKAGKRRNDKNGGVRDRRLFLLGWRLKWPTGSASFNNNQITFVPVDQWKRKDELMKTGATAIELFGDQEHTPMHGPSPWPFFDSEYRHEQGEPFFVLLGRDPQAPDILEHWANVREHAEPGDWKIKSAREKAQAMRAYKGIYPDIGMETDKYLDALHRIQTSENDE